MNCSYCRGTTLDSSSPCKQNTHLCCDRVISLNYPFPLDFVHGTYLHWSLFFNNFESCKMIFLILHGIFRSHKRHFALKTQNHLEMFALMHHVVMGDDPEVKAGKPSPDIFLAAMRRFEVLELSLQSPCNGYVLRNTVRALSFPWCSCLCIWFSLGQCRTQ